MIDKRDVEVRGAIKKMKEIAKTSGAQTREVIAQAEAGLSSYALAQMPDYETLARSVRNERKDADRKTSPTDLNELEFPPDLCKTSNGENFLMFDSGVYDDNKRIVIFSSKTSLDFLATCETIHMDGTFKSCPQLFSQLYVIHGN